MSIYYINSSTDIYYSIIGVALKLVFPPETTITISK